MKNNYLFLILAVALGIIGYFVGMNSNRKNSNVKNLPTDIPNTTTMTQETETDLEFAAKTLLELMEREAIVAEEQAKINKAAMAILALDKDLKLLSQLQLTESTGTFITLESGLNRTNAYDTLVRQITDSRIRVHFEYIKLKINATHIRTLIDTPEAGTPNGKATYLLIHPAKRDNSYTLVLAAGDRDGKTIKKNYTGGTGNQVLDEIEPCKGSNCPKLDQ